MEQAASTDQRATTGMAPGEPTEETPFWVCPGPEWGPDRETCGRLMPDKNRCQECSSKRTALRKQDRSTERKERGEIDPSQIEAETAETQPWNMWTD